MSQTTAFDYIDYFYSHFEELNEEEYHTLLRCANPNCGETYSSNIDRFPATRRGRAMPFHIARCNMCNMLISLAKNLARDRGLLRD